MNRDTGVYLDGTRFLAALIVVAGHIEWSFAPGFMPFIRDYHLATLAVGIFFVLSGFVIGHTVDRKETDAHSYFLNRAARVYSVVVPVLLLTLLLDSCGRWLAPDAYGTTLNFWGVCKELAKLLFSLTVRQSGLAFEHLGRLRHPLLVARARSSVLCGVWSLVLWG